MFGLRKKKESELHNSGTNANAYDRSTQTHRHTETQTHRHTHTQTHIHTGINTHRVGWGGVGWGGRDGVDGNIDGCVFFSEVR